MSYKNVISCIEKNTITIACNPESANKPRKFDLFYNKLQTMVAEETSVSKSVISLNKDFLVNTNISKMPKIIDALRAYEAQGELIFETVGKDRFGYSFRRVEFERDGERHAHTICDPISLYPENVDGENWRESIWFDVEEYGCFEQAVLDDVWESVKDDQFQKLRNAFIDARNKLEDYLETEV